MHGGSRKVIAWAVAGVLAVVVYQHWFTHGAANGATLALPSRTDSALPGGGVSDAGECGVKGYHYFKVATVMDTGGTRSDTPAGPQMMLGSYGAQQEADGPGEFDISLGIATGTPSRSLDLAAPLGAAGVAVEIEGPNGLVGGAHNLPVTLDDAAARLPGGKIGVGAGDGGLSVELTLPAAALCPGYTVMGVNQNLAAPVDSSNTITGQPPYTLTVSLSDPAVTFLRAQLGSTATGPVLAANNLVGPL